MKLFILDVSGFIFRAYFALPGMSNAAGKPTAALFGFIRSVHKLLQDFGCQHIVAVFDGPENKQSRREIYEAYKANRVKKYEDLPEQIEKAKEFCQLFGITEMEIEGVEADDTIGSIAKWAEKKGAEVYVCSGDKDLAQLVSEHIFLLNPWKENLLLDAEGVKKNYGVAPHQIIDFLAIMGDSSDNIPGITGFGQKTALDLLHEFGSLEEILNHPEKVKGAKKQQTLKEEKEIALLSQKLATLHTDIDFPKPKDFFALEPPDKERLKEFYLENGFTSLVKTLGEEEGADKVSYHLVDDEQALDSLIKKLQGAEQIAFDVETTNLNPLLAELVGIGFCVKAKEAYYVPLNGNLGVSALEKLKPLFKEGSFIAHHSKYDCHVMQGAGITEINICFDTILASYLLHASSRRHSLDALALEYFGKVKTDIKSLIGVGKKEISMSDVAIQKVSDYCCEDVDYTYRLYEKFSKELKKRNLEKLLFALELPLSGVLRKMEREGIYLDAPYLKKMGGEISSELDKIKEHIFTMAGESFNLNSPKQLSEILFDKLAIPTPKKGKDAYSTRVEVLEELAVDYPIAEQIIQFRGLEKLRSTYIEALPLQINPSTGRIHPTFNQFVTATGRLACQDPNLQNIPVRSKEGRRIREAFKPKEEGKSFLSADYSQIELRILAHLSEDPVLIKAFQGGEDIHAYTAALIFASDHVTNEQRHQAKAINFGIIYGQGAFGLAKELKIDRKTAASFIEAYYKRYPHVFSYVEKCIKETQKTEKSVTMWGRERQIPEINSSNAQMRMAAERLAVNSPLQGSAADLIKEAMLKLDKIITEKKMQAKMLLQIHDELIFEFPDAEEMVLKKIVQETMEGVCKLKVPLIVNIAVGKNWAASLKTRIATWFLSILPSTTISWPRRAMTL